MRLLRLVLPVVLILAALVGRVSAQAATVPPQLSARACALVRNVPSRVASTSVQRRRMERICRAQGMAETSSDTALVIRRVHIPLPVYEPTAVPDVVEVGEHDAAVVESEPANFSDLEAELLELTNVVRVREGWEPLRPNALLARSARLYAEEMSEGNFFAHTTPNGVTTLGRIRASGYLTPPCDCAWHYVIGENLAKGQTSAADVLRDWMQSPAHRGNILDGRFRDVGFGFVDGYWVQHFGTIETD